MIIVLKNVSAIASSILPWLADRSMLAAAGTLPMLGTLAAGNLTLLWFNRYGNTLSQQVQVLEELPFIRLIWATLFAWVILGLWIALHLELVLDEAVKWLFKISSEYLPFYDALLLKMPKRIQKYAPLPK